VLEAVNAIKDTDSVHYESLVNEYERLVQVIREDHIAAANSHLRDPTILAKLSGEIVAECKEILDYRLAAERWHLEIDSRSKDRIISFGEKLSCQFMAALLRDRVGCVASSPIMITNKYRASIRNM
jgi:aspartate kinase